MVYAVQNEVVDDARLPWLTACERVWRIEICRRIDAETGVGDKASLSCSWHCEWYVLVSHTKHINLQQAGVARRTDRKIDIAGTVYAIFAGVHSRGCAATRDQREAGCGVISRCRKGEAGLAAAARKLATKRCRGNGECVNQPRRVLVCSGVMVCRMIINRECVLSCPSSGVWCYAGDVCIKVTRVADRNSTACAVLGRDVNKVCGCVIDVTACGVAGKRVCAQQHKASGYNRKH